MSPLILGELVYPSVKKKKQKQNQHTHKQINIKASIDTFSLTTEKEEKTL